MSMKILEVSHVSKVYGSQETEVLALDDISFCVEKGEFISIVGPSGSGKSTLMHILGCVEAPTTGKVIINNVDVSQLSHKQLAIFRRRQIGLIYQFYNLIPVLTVEDNITLPLELDGREVSLQEIDYILKQINLVDRRHFLPSQLSGGQQQRVSIGRALMSQPSILLADEPTGNLDTRNSDNLIDLLIKSNKEHNQTILLITHNMDIALKANRLIQIEDGKIIGDTIIR